jgi:hypothetical protein
MADLFEPWIGDPDLGDEAVAAIRHLRGTDD